MSQQLLEYHLPQRYRISDLRNRLKQVFSLVELPVRQFIRCYYDTADWRLYRKAYLLLSETDAGQTLLLLRAINTPLGQRTLAVEKVPVFADDLSNPIWRQRLRTIISLRALLPQLTLHCHAITLQYLDEQGKICLHLAIENNKLVSDDGGYRQLGKRVCLLPVKGFEAVAQQVAQYLEHEQGLLAAEEIELTTGLALLQRRPGEDSGALEVRLEPDMPTAVALRRILLHLLDTMEHNEAGMLQDIDPEFLHDFRVAVRRTRSALGQIKGVFDKQRLQRFRNNFAWLGEVTGPARDLQVYLSKYESYYNSLPSKMRPHLLPLKAFLQSKLVKEKAIMQGHLQSQHYRHLKQDWRDFLLRPGEDSAALEKAQRPIIDVAGKRIWKMFRQVLDDGNTITAASPATKLHRLRIDCKNLRYLLEFFTSLYPPASLQCLIKSLKKLQDNLGDFNDLQVQMNSLRHFQELMAQENVLTPQTQAALEHLIAHLNELQLSQRLLFTDRFAQFSSPKHQSQFAVMFKPTQQDPASSC